MLEREGNDVLDALHGNRDRVSRKPFTDDDLDSAQVVGRAPVVLPQKLASEGWELEMLQLAILCEI
jgi:hypothetical protein